MIQDDNKKAELFNDYCCTQADLNDSETSVPDITDILINGLEQITGATIVIKQFSFFVIVLYHVIFNLKWRYRSITT
jgi:hypothetical protein